MLRSIFLSVLILSAIASESLTGAGNGQYDRLYLNILQSLYGQYTQASSASLENGASGRTANVRISSTAFSAYLAYLKENIAGSGHCAELWAAMPESGDFSHSAVQRLGGNTASYKEQMTVLGGSDSSPPVYRA